MIIQGKITFIRVNEDYYSANIVIISGCNSMSHVLVKYITCSDGPGSKVFDPSRVESAIYGLGLNLENFP